jgi:APA family basic amino acid/polyamine antiporter
MANSFLSRRKPVELVLQEMAGESRLNRVLGRYTLASLGVGAIIGTGIFVLTGVAAHDKAGPALMLSDLPTPMLMSRSASSSPGSSAGT